MPYASKEDRQRQTREWYRNASPGKKKEINRKANDRRTKVRRHVDRIKIERGCIDCGFSGHPAALDFDHIKGKDMLVSSAKSIRRADEEIKKCVVRCARCHRIRTWERMTGKKAIPADFFSSYRP